ncbi:MAG: hypothetical protein KBT63_01640 [Porticoccaceae bacterium]|nr:hypothetical protein [Porticoccaceae bacterium]
MNNMKKIICIGLVSLFSWNSYVLADDIDIYLGSKPASAPLVMLMLDWRPSVFSNLCSSMDASCEAIMSPEAAAILKAARADAGTPLSDSVSLYEAFVAVLQVVVANPAFDPIHMGLMLSNFTDGGTILEGYKRLGDTISADTQSIRPALAVTTQNRDYLISRLREITEPSNNSKSHKLQPSETFYEMYSYLNGLAVQFGDAAGTTNNFQSISPPNPGFDSFIQSGGNYIVPQQFTDYACTSTYAIMMAMNVANNDNDLDAEITSSMSATAAVKFEDMLTYMNANDIATSGAATGDQNLITWVISDSGSKGSTGVWAAAGGSGDGLLNFEDAVALQATLEEAFTEIISVSSTFVAASVPVNVFNRTESLDNLYVALFEARTTIDWPGNLKKLKLVDEDINVDTTGDGVADSTDGFFDNVIDVLDNDAFEVDGNDIGRIRTGALTFWTDVGELPPPDTNEGEVVDRDGRSVLRGGAGQQVPGFISDAPGDENTDTDARQVYVTPASGAALEALGVIGATPSASEIIVINELLGVDYSALSAGDKNTAEDDANEIIKWMRGEDVNDADGDSSVTDARPWIMGASIHSRPLAINYGTRDSHSTTNPNILLMMGTNDGYFHFFENTDPGVGDSDAALLALQSGTELLAFMPQEMLSRVKTFKTNTQSSNKMIYGVDGEPASLVVDDDRDGNIEVGDEVYVYFGFRRGGNGYYALDVSNPDVATVPPTIAWKIFQTSGGSFDELGLTFSKPVVTKVNYNGTITDVVIFAGGYNGGWDSGFTARLGKDLGDADDTVGNAIYVVNARTGALIWKVKQGSGAASNTVFQHADMVDSIPATVVPLDVNNNGVTDRLYVGDMGGAVWRVDMPEGSATNQRRDSWFASKFAELGTDGAPNDRRFFHSVDIVLTKDDTGDYDGIAISSGDRADPLGVDTENYLFYMKDRTTTSGAASVKTRSPYVLSDLADVTPCLTGAETGCAALSMANGWRIQLVGTGEKSLSKPIVDGGIAVFTSFEPSVGVSSCDATEGEGFAYLVNLADGTAVNSIRKYPVGKGIPPGVVAINGALIIPGGGIIEDGDGAADRKKILKSTSKGSWLIYWRELGIDDL